MSSPPKQDVNIKGGHLPAVKAGGMRIVQKHQPAAAAPDPPQKDEDEEVDEEEYVSSSPPKAPVIVSGVVTKQQSCKYHHRNGSLSCVLTSKRKRSRTEIEGREALSFRREKKGN
ncbi:death-associated protein 1 homolog isoform X1 [Clinocottus analis]|uniref:death-associated protein 1 homolog isoform X1 n=1 Tax=Clinocottus analis TaxID=304258 RepID=UPI0035C00061